jgi:hypothetical protein
VAILSVGLTASAALMAAPAGPAAPEAVSVSRGEASGKVRWTDPYVAPENPISGHDLEVAEGPDYQDWMPAATAGAPACSGGQPATCEVTVSGLSNGSRYQARVRAVTARGPGPWAMSSGWFMPAVLAELPGVPENLTGRPGPGSVTAEWTPPKTLGAGAKAISQYRVVALDGETLGGHCETRGAPPPSTCTITGLNAGTAYTLKVRALNDRRQFSDFSPPAGPYVPVAH